MTRRTRARIKRARTRTRTRSHTHTEIRDKVRKRKSAGIPLARALLWTRTDISLFPIALSPPFAFFSSFSRPRVCLSSRSSSPPDQLLDRFLSPLLALAENRGMQYHFNLYPTFVRSSCFAKLKPSLSEIVTVCRIRSNYYNLNYSLRSIVGRPDCPCGSPL